MIKLEKVVSASKLFGDGYLTEVYFDTHKGEGNFLVVEVWELVAWIRQSGKDTAKEIAHYFEQGHAADAEALSAILMEFAANLLAVESLGDDVNYILFDDGKLF